MTPSYTPPAPRDNLWRPAPAPAPLPRQQPGAPPASDRPRSAVPGDAVFVLPPLTPPQATEPPPALPEALRVSVDGGVCKLYGLCQQEAPGVFDLAADGRLRYPAAVGRDQVPGVRQAARICPAQAIALRTMDER